jgi:hypothetical protein
LTAIAFTISSIINLPQSVNVMRLWFLQLSGWPVFLSIVGVMVVLMLALSVGMTRISSRSVAQNFVLAFFRRRRDRGDRAWRWPRSLRRW